MGQHIHQHRFIQALRSALGVPYVWGGESLTSGVDCSGLVQAAAIRAGIKNVPRTSQEQFRVGTPVQMNGLRPGDLIFSNWGSEVGAGHVSVYIGHGRIIEAAGQGIPVRVASISVLNGHILGARRILANPGQSVQDSSRFAAQQTAYFHQSKGGQSQGGGPNIGAALAALSSIRPVQIPKAAPLKTAAQSVAQTIAAHQPQVTADQLNPYLQAPQFPTPIGQTPTDYAGQLNSIHQKLLKGAGA